MPAPSIAGVFGIARTTGMPSSSVASSIAFVFTEAANEMISFSGVNTGLICRTTSITVNGFTPMKISSASRAADALSVVTRTFSRSASCAARFSCCTVAVICSG